MDNFIRPVLIKRGTQLPLLLIFAGVIGGLVAFGVIGLFIGPRGARGGLHAARRLGVQRRIAGDLGSSGRERDGSDR